MGEPNRQPVLFVGAGPGDPELITVAGKKALEAADLIVYAGSLVSPAMLGWAKPGCRVVDSAPLDLATIVTELASGHEAGLRVVRLHTGDPSLYGAMAEQIRELDRREIPWRVIPGVTAAFAAAASLGLEYTLPEITQSLILTRAAGRTPVPPEEDLELLAAHRASLAIYLSAGQAARVGRVCGQHYGPDSPLAVVFRASWPDEKIIWTSPDRLAEDLKAAGIDRQALILVGPAVAAVAPGGDRPEKSSRLYDQGFSHAHRAGREKA